MKTRAISYSPDMILARTAGRKTQTRRLVVPQPDYVNALGVPFYPNGKGPVDYRQSPYGQEGDRLWVREEHRILALFEGSAQARVQYRADGEERLVNLTDADMDKILSRKTPRDHWMRARFMLRSLSRGLDEITAVRVQRLQDISPADCEAEGIAPSFYHTLDGAGCQARVHDYKTLWESINGPGSWDANPWVWAITFQPIPL